MSELITVDGLVTRVYPHGDHDRLIHVVTPDRGRLPVMVKGGQSKRNPMAAYTQLFTYGNYELYRKGELYWLRGGSVNHAFYELSCDVTRMALGAYLCDVTSDMTAEVNPDMDETVAECATLLRMLLNSLYALCRGDKPQAIIKGVFELRAASLGGYTPHLTGCALCGSGYPENSYFDIMNGAMICADCQTKRNRLGGLIADRRREENGERSIIVPMSSSVLAAVRYALTAPDPKIFSFALKDREEEIAFGRVAEAFLLNQIERGFATLDFYHSVAD